MRRSYVSTITICTTVLFLFSCSAENPAQEIPEGQFFTVRVINEDFVIFVTDQETIRLATENFQGRNNRFPMDASFAEMAASISRGAGICCRIQCVWLKWPLNYAMDVRVTLNRMSTIM